MEPNAEKPKYWDIRSELFTGFFQAGLSYQDYLKTGTADQQDRWNNMGASISLTEAQHERVASFTRKMNIIVMSGIWCGDCVRQGPMLWAIEKANPLLNFRYLDNKENPELQEELRINGAQKVPVVVVMSEDFYEVGRFGDRHLSVYRRKAESELGAACDAGIIPPSGDELETEVGEWIDYFERGQWLLRLAPALRKRHGD